MWATRGGLLLVCALSFVGLNGADPSTATTDAWREFSATCSAEEASKNVSVSCQGARIVRRFVEQILETTKRESDIRIVDGISLVEVPGSGAPRKARFLKGFGSVGPFLQFLEGRELRVKLPSLLPKNIDSALMESLATENVPLALAEQARGGGGGGGGGGFGGGGGGKKGGGGGYLLLALMMGKMLAALGFGGLGLLTMKALMVSALALMLSMIVAVKKLTSGHDDGGGGHHVVYAQEVGHHHRRRRSLFDDADLRLPYRGYAHLYGDTQAS